MQTSRRGPCWKAYSASGRARRNCTSGQSGRSFSVAPVWSWPLWKTVWLARCTSCPWWGERWEFSVSGSDTFLLPSGWSPVVDNLQHSSWVEQLDEVEKDDVHAGICHQNEKHTGWHHSKWFLKLTLPWPIIFSFLLSRNPIYRDLWQNIVIPWTLELSLCGGRQVLARKRSYPFGLFLPIIQQVKEVKVQHDYAICLHRSQSSRSCCC